MNTKGKSQDEIPYMQRRGGSFDGSDIKGKGRGQGRAGKRNSSDDKYDKLKEQGKLDSVSIFGGVSLPWTNQATNSLGKPQKSELEKKLLKDKLDEEEPKKKFFGLF